jgi:O-antigen/teichoic acid export membrane protein
MSGKAALSGLFWNGTESAVLQTVQLLVSMVLARLLTASDFGLIALISVFITLTDAISQGGFRSVIIVFPDLTDIDCSTAFVYNLAVASLLYLTMFFTAPLIAGFYQEPQLVVLIRVLGLVNLIHSGYFVQDALLQRYMRFKLLAQRNIMASLISGGIAISMALLGAGVWSLVSLTITRALVINIYLWIKSVWKFSLKFSYKSFRKSFSYGSRMMISVFTGVLYNNLNNLLIGKFYSKADLGYYYQARKLRNVPLDSTTAVLTKTTGPLLAKYQRDIPNLHKTYFHITRIAAYTIIPLVVLLFVISRDLIVVMFSDRWLEAVPIFRIIILTGLFMPFIIINGLSPAVMGDSKYYLKLDTAIKVMFLVVTFITLRFGLLIFIAAQTSLTAVQMIINAWVARKFFKVSLTAQIKNFLPSFLFCSAAGVITWLITGVTGLPAAVKLPTGIILFIGLYVGLVYVFERNTFDDVVRLSRSGLQRLKQRNSQQSAGCSSP